MLLRGRQKSQQPSQCENRYSHNSSDPLKMAESDFREFTQCRFRAIYWETALLSCLVYDYVHYSDDIKRAMACQITCVTIVYPAVCSGTGQRKHQYHRITGLCEGNSPVTGEIAAQRASNAANVYIWWRHLMMFCVSAYEWAIPVAI